MKKAALILLVGGGGLTLVLWIIWALGFIFASASIGNLIHLALVFSMLTLLAALVGLILLIVALVSNRNAR